MIKKSSQIQNESIVWFCPQLMMKTIKKHHDTVYENDTFDAWIQ